MGSLRADHTSLTPDFSLKEKETIYFLCTGTECFLCFGSVLHNICIQNGDTELGLIFWQIPPVLTDDTQRARLKSGEGPLLLFP